MLAAIVALAVLIAIAKPWAPAGAGPGPAVPVPTVHAAPAPSGDAITDPAIGFSNRAYDPRIFGFREPAATWGIWPAGFLVTFGFVIQVPDVPPAPTPAPGGSGPRATQPAASPGGPGGEAAIGWPAGFEVPDGNHLLLIGINMPLGHTVQAIELTRFDALGGAVVVPLQRLESPWPSHFVVVALAEGSAKLLTIWPAGRYRLDVTFGPAVSTRSIEIIVAPSH